MKWVNGELVETKYDGPTHASTNAGSPMEATKQARVVVMSKATFDQAREAMRDLYEFFIQNHENVGLELYGRVNGAELTPSARRLNELLDQMNDVLAAMEATHEL